MPTTPNKTQPTNASVPQYIQALTDQTQKEDVQIIISLMKKISGEEPVIWGKMVGFGEYNYKYASGREGNIFKIGFAPRAKEITFYVHLGLLYSEDLLLKLGKYKMGKGCLNIKKLSDINMDVLEEIIQKTLKQVELKYPKV